MKRHLLAAVAALGLLGLTGIAEAQTGITGAAVPIPQVTSYGPNDLIQIIPNGYPQVGNQYISATTLLGADTLVPIYVSVATTSATPPTNTRAIRGEASVGVSISGSTTYNIVGERGAVIVPAAVTVNDYSAYLYGSQGKAILPGTITAANICGLCGQWDISATTFASSGSSISVAWLDAGATASASAISNLAGNDSSMLRITNTTAAPTAQIIEAVATAPVFMALSANGLPAPAYVKSTTSCNRSSSTTATAIEILVNGTPYYIALCSTL